MRPKQWTKNAFVFAGVIFAQKFTHADYLVRSAIAFACFCVLSGCIYIINDVADRESDSRHPIKSKRPIASGKINPYSALATAVVLIAAVLAYSYQLQWEFFLTLLGYTLFQLAYSFYIKHLFIVDVIFIALGFLLRVISGSVIINVEISSWLLLCTIFLSLFLGLAKRRYELMIMSVRDGGNRKNLKIYNIGLTDQFMSIIASASIMSYALYTLAPETIVKFGTRNLVFTIPFVVYGILRYYYLATTEGQTDTPENLLVSDVPLLTALFLWILSVILILLMR